MLKKHASLILCAFAFLLFQLNSCNDPPFHNSTTDCVDITSPITINTSSQTETMKMIFNEYFDWNKHHAPSNEEAKKIEPGMTISEITQLIGMPHSPGDYSGPISLNWYTKEGNVCCIVFSIPKDTPSELSTIEKLMNYGIAVKIVFDPINSMK